MSLLTARLGFQKIQICNNICLVNKVYSINKIYKFLRSCQVHSNICLNSLSLLILFSFRAVIFYDGTLQKEWKSCHCPYGLYRIQNQLIFTNQCFYQLKSGLVMPPTAILFFEVVLTNLAHWFRIMNLDINFSVSGKICTGILVSTALNNIVIPILEIHSIQLFFSYASSTFFLQFLTFSS